MKEIWKPIPGHNGFEASNFGRIRTTGRIRYRGNIPYYFKPKIKHQHTVAGEYFGFWSDRNNLSHRSVWEAFNGPIPNGMIINHINGVKKDNRIVNLEVCTHKQNVHHALNFLKVMANGSGKELLSEKDVRTIRHFACNGSCRILAKVFGINAKSIHKIKNGITYNHYQRTIEEEESMQFNLANKHKKMIKW